MIGFDVAERARAASMFETLRAGSLDAPGVTRASYGAGERMAHALAREVATDLNLDVSTDFAGNLYMTMPGMIARCSPGKACPAR